MKAGLQICFKSGSLNGSDFIKFYNDFVEFDPLFFIKSSKCLNWNETKHKKQIEKASSNDDIILSNKNFDLCSIMNTGGVQISHRSIQIVENYDLLENDINKIESFIFHPSFVSAFYFDEDYRYSQSEQFESILQMRGLFNAEPRHFIIDKYGQRKIDISNNPGRSSLVNSTWVMPAFKMWFGPSFYKIISKDKILSFKEAFLVKELSEEVIFIQLFEKIEESGSPKNREIQKKIRDWLGFDQLSW